MQVQGGYLPPTLTVQSSIGRVLTKKCRKWNVGITPAIPLGVNVTIPDPLGTKGPGMATNDTNCVLWVMDSPTPPPTFLEVNHTVVTPTAVVGTRRSWPVGGSGVSISDHEFDNWLGKTAWTGLDLRHDVRPYGDVAEYRRKLGTFTLGSVP